MCGHHSALDDAVRPRDHVAGAGSRTPEPASPGPAAGIGDGGGHVMSTPGPSPRPFFLPLRQDWLARRREEIIEPDLPIVDPHHHLSDHHSPLGRYLFDEL